MQWGEKQGKKNTIPIINHLKGNKICQILGFTRTFKLPFPGKTSILINETFQ